MTLTDLNSHQQRQQHFKVYVVPTYQVASKKKVPFELCMNGIVPHSWREWEEMTLQRPAEAMARAAGTAFRLFAGTDSLNVGLTASHTATLDPNDPQVHHTETHAHTSI